jgi:hypothetical protein
MNGRIHDQAQWQANSGLSEGLVSHLIHISPFGRLSAVFSLENAAV